VELTATTAGEARGAECEDFLRFAHGEEIVGEAQQLHLRLRGGLPHQLAQQMVDGVTPHESKSIYSLRHVLHSINSPNQCAHLSLEIV